MTRPEAGARPGAARVLPLRLMSRMPLLRRLARLRTQTPPVKKAGVLSPRRLVDLLRRSTPVPTPVPKLRIPFVAPMIRGVRYPIERTAAVVRAARDVRKPLTRWERLRHAARTVIDDPVAATRWERLMGLGVGLVAGGRAEAASKAKTARTPRPRAPATPRPAQRLRGGLRRLQALLNENAGPRTSVRDRRGFALPKSR